MKIKLAYFLVFILLSCFAFCQNFDKSYECYYYRLNKGKIAFYKNEFKIALDNFYNAKSCCPVPKDSIIDQWIEKATSMLKGMVDTLQYQKDKLRSDSVQKQNLITEIGKALDSFKVANAKVERLNKLTVARNLALQSKYVKDTLQGLLALHAFLLNNENGGPPNEPVIYNSLRNYCNSIDILQGANIKTDMVPRAICVLKDSLIFACIDGRVFSRSFNKSFNNSLLTIPKKANINTMFFNPDGSQFITGYENYSIGLWDIKNKVRMLKELNGHKGLLRAIAFCPDNTKIATSGRDSTILI
jgi:WD40 repeat protein